MKPHKHWLHMNSQKCN